MTLLLNIFSVGEKREGEALNLVIFFHTTLLNNMCVFLKMVPYSFIFREETLLRRNHKYIFTNTEFSA